MYASPPSFKLCRIAPTQQQCLEQKCLRHGFLFVCFYGIWWLVGVVPVMGQEIFYARALGEKDQQVIVPISTIVNAAELRRQVERSRAWLEQSQYQAALSLLDDVLSSRPSIADAWSLRGFAHYNIGHYEEAVSDYSMALLMTCDARVLFNRALAYKKLHRYREALQDLDKALRLNADNVYALLEKGNIMGELRQWHEARRHYEEVVTLVPSLVEGWINLGRACMEIGDLSAALRAFDQALAHSPEPMVQVYLYRSRCWLLQHELKAALQDAMEALYLDPEQAEVYYTIGRIEQHAGKHEEALISFEAALELSSSTRYILAYGESLLALGAYREAITRCNEVIAQEPDNIHAWALRDEAFYHLDQLSRQWSARAR